MYKYYILILTGIFSFGQTNKEDVLFLNKKDNFISSTYNNPIIHQDYSDPDVVRVNNTYYMTASSFNCVPGLPILKSYNLVDWELVSYALNELEPKEVYDLPQHGKGVWAPCIRYYNNLFYIFYPDPDFGIYQIHSENPEGEWSKPILIKAGKGLIDPSPLWDDDGKAYLTYAFAGSRAGIKSMLMVCEMNDKATETFSNDVLIFDGHSSEPTIEGPKFYKKNNFYYIFAPAGGVSTGWQTVLRSKSPLGPYEKRKVLHQGNTNINGPHQGAWVNTKDGSDWFIHFQDKGVLGRIVHLQPMFWINDWPFIGIDQNNDGIGEPVNTYKVPVDIKKNKSNPLSNSDDFNTVTTGLQWQWHANRKLQWGFPSSDGNYVLNCIPKPNNFKNLFQVPNLFLQKLPGEKFEVTTKLELNFIDNLEYAGFVIMGKDYTFLKLQKTNDHFEISHIICINADKDTPEEVKDKKQFRSKDIFLKAKLNQNGFISFSFSEKDTDFQDIGIPFEAKEGIWIGAKIGFFSLRENFTNNAGNIKIDYINFN